MRKAIADRAFFTSKLPDIITQLGPKGNYAVPVPGSSEIDFIRVVPMDEMKRDFRGAYFMAQTRHSDLLEDAMVLLPSDHWRVRMWPDINSQLKLFRPYVMDVLLEAAADPFSAAVLFAEELNRCWACGKSLTDDRSRWYAIGPDCETRHENYMIKRTLQKGFFDPEAADTALLNVRSEAPIVWPTQKYENLAPVFAPSTKPLPAVTLDDNLNLEF